MPTENKTSASIRLDYGSDHGTYTFSGLRPDATPMDAYLTAAGINAVQTRRYMLVTMTVNSRLQR